VVDRGLPLERPEVRVFSGDSQFSHQVFASRLPIRGLDPANWSVMVGRVLHTAQWDGVISLITHPPRGGHPQVDVFAGFNRLLVGIAAISTPWSSGPAPDFRVLLGGSLKDPAIYAVDLRHPPGMLQVAKLALR
jgi:hypothetical protein